MFLETVDQFATIATTKAAFLRRSPVGFWISSMMAGAYVGLGIILIFCVGANLDPSIRPIVMGASFGIALTLVIFAGSDLFTGHTMFMTLGWLRRRTSLRDLAFPLTYAIIELNVGPRCLRWRMVRTGVSYGDDACSEGRAHQKSS